ncbi:MAG: sulfotransferase family 2 domain-containing protein [Nostocoides sp.]
MSPTRAADPLSQAEALERKADGYLCVGTVRHPLSRLLSCWTDKVMAEPYYVEFEMFPEFKPKMPFADFVDGVRRIPDVDSEPHFRSLSFSLTVASDSALSLIPDVVVSQERMDSDWERCASEILRHTGGEVSLPSLPILNPTVANSHSALLTSEIREAVYERYISDFALFGYDWKVDPLFDEVAAPSVPAMGGGWRGPLHVGHSFDIHTQLRTPAGAPLTSRVEGESSDVPRPDAIVRDRVDHVSDSYEGIPGEVDGGAALRRVVDRPGCECDMGDVRSEVTQMRLDVAEIRELLKADLRVLRNHNRRMAEHLAVLQHSVGSGSEQVKERRPPSSGAPVADVGVWRRMELLVGPHLGLATRTRLVKIRDEVRSVIKSTSSLVKNR